MTMDIETKNVAGKLTPIMVGISSKFNNIALSINKFRSLDHMMNRALKYLMFPSNNGMVVYMHNMVNLNKILIYQQPKLLILMN